MIVPFKELVGKTLKTIEVCNKGEFITLETRSGETYQMSHTQDCCESVRIEEVIGEFEDIVGSPILLAEEVENIGNLEEGQMSDSCTWTFYKLSTIKGSVTIRWLGESNGYYSEKVDFVKL
jgi:hypothetical protein